MPSSGPRNRIAYPTHKLIIDSYNPNDKAGKVYILYMLVIILCNIYLANFLCYAYCYAHLSQISNNFNIDQYSNNENSILGK